MPQRAAKPFIERIMPRHMAFSVSLLVGIGVLVVTLFLMPSFAFSLAAIAMFSVFLLLTLLRIPHLTGHYLRTHASAEDTPVAGIFLVTLIVVVASVVSIFLALHGGDEPDIWGVAASVSSVVLGWFTIHTMAALHYAYEYYRPNDDGEGERHMQVPGDDEPDISTFLYFSYVLATAFAVSDIKVTSNGMRRMVMRHSVFSYFFNTTLFAATVNIVIALGKI
ncbi:MULTISPECIES: DUF1345 domain-containing protein [unclassified Devosia]|uniref:DUF1345 domain-containing protein n=1 Tax=unclassified Devosia TaxID=196773 RepID=UPI00145F90AD|nr:MULTISPECIES: DUF1345 domain-containing protein [unclassified Devosia]MBJ6986032.1 DUF1345 domain-containing protein [Devosia sp. MC521]MBJ7578944.1 DUF1345 domain-containing protein [Devosia sp. MC532]QMW61403.1 DUF1345 domain-containing protein [Devosia sp. MC521]